MYASCWQIAKIKSCHSQLCGSNKTKLAIEKEVVNLPNVRDLQQRPSE